MSIPLAAETAAAPAVLRRPVREERSSGVVVLGQTARKAARSGAIWGYIFGAVVASSAISYTRAYKTRTQREHLAAAFGSNNAGRALFGPAPQLQTVAGFTVFKASMTLMILGAIWGLLTSTRLLRGEEDAGRWELLLSGQTTRRGASGQALGGLAIGAATLWAITTVFTVAAGRYSKVDIAAGPGTYFALALVSTAVMFLAVGALTSQLAPTRRQAAASAGWFLGAAYALRMVADSGVGLHGLIWASPLGWVEELQPLTAPRPLAFLPIFGFAAVVALAAVRLAANRDVSAGILPDRTHARARTRLLSGQLGLTVRLVRPTVTAWICALGATGLVLGLVARSAGTTISGSSVKTIFSRLGAPGTGAEAFLGVSFIIVAVLVAFVAAGQVTAARLEEAQGRLDHLLVGPVSRLGWLAGRVGVAVVVLLAGGVVTGIATWLGTISQNAQVGLGTLLDAGLNVVPPAVCLLGIGVLAMGVWPRATANAVYAVLGWSLLVELVGGVVTTSHWLADTSLFHQMAAAPAASPDWTTGAVMVGIGAACAGAGALAFHLRDVQGE
ncbi:MAG: ABC transporter permease subunit [Acidimicrobiales bacterium]